MSEPDSFSSKTVVEDWMVEALAKFIYEKEAAKCSNIDDAMYHRTKWRRALPEAREMLVAVFGRAADETPAVTGWQPIETAPKDGRTLLLGYVNSCGNWRTLRGQWYSWELINEEWEEPENGSEGWYETSVENDTPPNCWQTEPTHWMPLPAPPDKTNEERK